MKFKRLYFHYAALLRQACKERLGIRTTVLLLSFFTGIFGAAAAIVIKNLLFLNVSFLNRVLSATQYRYIYLAFPLIGIILTIFFVKHFVKDDISHGVSIVLKAISKSSGKLRSHNIYSSIVASSLTVGFGGSVGLEAPIVLTGSAIGSNLGKLFNL
ncbi:MAG: chloride channel protein, partial [Bacteroidales bacterium]|nr:chloride channel protein [Bacteroidales bacterium]